MADERKDVDWEQLKESLKVAEELGISPTNNGGLLVTSAFQLASQYSKQCRY